MNEMAIFYFRTDDNEKEAWEIAYPLNGKRCFDASELNEGDVVLDIIKGLEAVKQVNLNTIQESGFLKNHSMELSNYIRIMKVLDEKKIMTLGIPKNYKKEKAIQEVKELLNI